jgi:2-oxoisovalerate dehydrogenase E1 component beta subunit
VIFFEPKRIYNGPFDGHHDRPVSPGQAPASEVPEGHYAFPLGKARSCARAKRDRAGLRHHGHVALAAAEDTASTPR